jgi:branched-subunit amino acid transport protein
MCWWLAFSQARRASKAGAWIVIWWVMVCAGLANFLSRFLMFSGIRGIRVPERIEPFLAYVPTAVMSAMIADAILGSTDAAMGEVIVRCAVGALALITALLFRSVLLTIIVGLLAYQWLL